MASSGRLYSYPAVRRATPCRLKPELQPASLVVAENHLKRVEVVALSELLEGFSRMAMAPVTLQHFLERRFELFDGNSLKHLPADSLVDAEAAAHEYVIAFNRF